nr:hypothetical protein [Tanacetum cinerariifolium]
MMLAKNDEAGVILSNEQNDLLLVDAFEMEKLEELTYYVTRPNYVVDYDDDYQGDVVCDDQEDRLTTKMMLLTRAIAQCYSTPANRLCTSSNTRNQVVAHVDRVNIRCRNVRNGGRFTRSSSNTQGDYAESENVQKETGNGNVQIILRNSSSRDALNVQCYKFNAKGTMHENVQSQ